MIPGTFTTPDSEGTNERQCHACRWWQPETVFGNDINTCHATAPRGSFTVTGEAHGMASEQKRDGSIIQIPKTQKVTAVLKWVPTDANETCKDFESRKENS